MNRRTYLTGLVACIAGAGCLGEPSADNQPEDQITNSEISTETVSISTTTGTRTTTESIETSTEELTSVATVESLETSPSCVNSNYSGPQPIGDLNPTIYNRISETQEAVSFGLPTIQLPKEYSFSRATVAISDSTADTNQEYVALIYANHSNSSATNWAVVYIVHPQDKANFHIGQNISVGNRTGAYYEGPNKGHLLFVCDNSEYELSGPFAKDQLVQIAQSICSAK